MVIVSHIDSTLLHYTGAENYEDLQDADLRYYLETQARASKQAMTIDKLDRFVKADLKTNMRGEHSVSRTQTCSFPTTPCFASML